MTPVVKKEKPSTPVKKPTPTVVKQEKVTPKKSVKSTPTKQTTTGKGKGKEVKGIWRWWEEPVCSDGRKWTTLEHNGPLFPPPYESLPNNVKFFYNGAEVKLKDPAEEIMTFYARMLDHDYTSRPAFNQNFMSDWRKAMTPAERELIKDIRKCDFTQVANYFKELSEQRKNMSKEEKKQLKEENERLRKTYGYCLWDTHEQSVGNYKIEPPGLFRGRGEHPKMGCVKTRIQPEDIIINIGREAQVPKPPEGHRWKEIRHDNKVTWLVMWTENIRGNNKYIMLNASSRVKVGGFFLVEKSERIIVNFRPKGIGKSMKKLENFIERLTLFARTTKPIGKAKKCAFVNVLLQFISSIKYKKNSFLPTINIVSFLSARSSSWQRKRSRRSRYRRLLFVTNRTH